MPGLEALKGKSWDVVIDNPTTVIRPGLIVGPGDETDRVQFIDARDPAQWMIRVAENGATGRFNVTGPTGAVTSGFACVAGRPPRALLG